MLNFLKDYPTRNRFLLFKSFKLKLTLPKTVVIIILTLILVQLGCENSVGPGSDLPPLPNDDVVYLSMDGTEAGLLILNANTLDLIDSLITAPGVPWTIEFSPDNITWYSCWGRGDNYSIYSCNLKPLNIQNQTQLQYSKSFLVKSYDQKYLIAYGYKGIDIFDRASLSLIHQDTSSLFDSYSGLVFSRTSNRVYFGLVENREFVGFGIYDVDSLKVTKTLKLFNSNVYQGLTDVDYVVSLDEKFLFLTTWTWKGLGGFGSFFVIDLNLKKIINQFQVGAFSQLCISPDGQSIYISDPGGYLFNLPSSGNVWRYDVNNNSIQVLISNLYNSDKIAVADDNRTLFITPDVAFDLQNGERVWLVKVDGLNGQLLDSYPVSYDSTGFYTNNPRNVRMGIYNNIK